MRAIKKYYSMATTKDSADIYIYGDITSWPWLESDVSAYSLANAIEGLDVPEINVYINSYGGEVAEGLAIHNSLVRHSAKVTTYCDGFACSAAAVIYMAGDIRVMYPASLLMIHNAWQYAAGNADELRKTADDLETISQASANAFKRGITISDEKLSELLANETWILPADALEMGFATSIASTPIAEKASASVRQSIIQTILQAKTRLEAEGSEDPPEEEEPQEPITEEPETPAPNQKKFFNFRKDEQNGCT